MNKKVKKYEEGMKGLVDYDKDPIHILKVLTLDDGCVMCIYKSWNKNGQRWYYSGIKMTELLYWNSLLWKLSNEDRSKLFELNGFDWEQVKGY